MKLNNVNSEATQLNKIKFHVRVFWNSICHDKNLKFIPLVLTHSYHICQ
jgi:hypothetical protein